MASRHLNSTLHFLLPVLLADREGSCGGIHRVLLSERLLHDAEQLGVARPIVEVEIRAVKIRRSVTHYMLLGL